MMGVDVFAYLAAHNIPFEKTEHPPVYTVEQAKSLVPSMRGANTKNLFVRNKRGQNHYLIIVGYDTIVDLKALSRQIGETPFSMASPERLLTHLGVEPGSVSLLAVMNNGEKTVRVIIDDTLWQADFWKCHPHINTSTLSIARSDIERILELTGHEYQVLAVPNIQLQESR